MNRLHGIVVIPNEHKESFIQTGCIFKFFVYMAGIEWRDCGVKSGRVSQTGIGITSGKGTRCAAHGTAVGIRRAMNLGIRTLFFGTHLSRHIHFRSGNVAMHVDPPGHHNHSRCVDGLRWPRGTIGGCFNKTPLVDPEITDLSINAVGRIVDCSARYFEHKNTRAKK